EISADFFESQANAVRFKELPHYTAAHLAVPVPPVLSCRFFDLPPVNLQNLQERLTKKSLAS
ncbi:MAG: hypothetical protein IJH03_08920, partial [Clostridia bacterium]|nr:hypothetical protein [Clostridia bacterium]